MHLTFATPDVRALCERTNRAAQALGVDRASALQARLADLRAAKNLAEFPFPLTSLDGGVGQRYSVLVDPKVYLEFEVRDRGPARSITNIKILNIGDVHA